MRPIQVVIHRAALTHNLEIVRRCAPNSRVMAVIKANAYGHGLLRAAQALAGADGFAVVELDAAVRLREAGFRQPILLLEGFFRPEEAPIYEHHGLAAVIHCPEQLDMLSAFRGPLDVFLKLDTGMHRLGFQDRQFAAALERVRSAPAVRSVTLMTHFARADEPGGVEEQLARFRALTEHLELPRSLANSAAILCHPATHADWVRPGIMLYGASAFPDRPAAEFDLQPAMSFYSEVIAVQDLVPGERVGYGGTFEARERMRVGVVACGYADGYSRHSGTGAPVLVDGRRTRLLGRVSMDMLCADLSALPGAGVGSRVTLWGKGLPVDEVAGAAGTIGYELLCAVAPRVPVTED
jgi:alanine racemase